MGVVGQAWSQWATWKFFGGAVQIIRLSSRSYRSRPHFYTPTCLHRHGFTAGRWAVLWTRDYSGRGF